MIKLQILLRSRWRNAEGVARAREIAEQLGIKPTAEGRATLSAEVEPEAFKAIFQEPAREVEPSQPGERDFGGPGGHIAGELPVPEPLRKYIESITVASPYLRL